MTQIDAIVILLPLVGKDVRLTISMEKKSANKVLECTLYKISFAKHSDNCGAYIICKDGYSAEIEYERIEQCEVKGETFTQVYP